jgi:hypothetical protein
MGAYFTETMRKIPILGLAALSAITIATYADVIPTLSSITQNGNDFTWNYSANVLVDQRVETGDFFTIYDFGNFVPGSNMQPAGWDFSSSLLGRTPAFLTPREYTLIHDDPAVLNLTWTYIGQNPIIGPNFLGIFSVTNNTNQIITGQFAAQATHNGGLFNGGKTANIGDVSVPVPEMSALLPILSVCMASLLALVPSFLRRRRIA